MRMSVSEYCPILNTASPLKGTCNCLKAALIIDSALFILHVAVLVNVIGDQCISVRNVGPDAHNQQQLGTSGHSYSVHIYGKKNMNAPHII